MAHRKLKSIGSEVFVNRIDKHDFAHYAVSSSTSSSRHKEVIKMNVYNREKEKSRSTGSLVNAFALMHFPAGDDLS